MTSASAINDLIPVHCYLHRVFPSGAYNETAKRLVRDRLFQPRKDCDPFFLICPVDWDAQESVADRNWRMQLQGWTMFHPVMNFFDEYDDKQEALSFFVDILKDWWSNYSDDPDDVLTTRMPSSYAWYDMAVGFRTLIIAFFLNRIKFFELDAASDDLLVVQQCAAKHLRHLANRRVFSLNNHGFFQIHGLMMLLREVQVQNAEEYWQYGLRRMEELVASQFDELGVHVEHSPHYHFYSFITLEAVVETGLYDQSKLIKERKQVASAARKWLVDGENRPYCVGDSILTQQDGFEAGAAGDGVAVGKFVVGDFSASGYLIARSQWSENSGNTSTLFLMGMYNSKAHKHRDCLSFEWICRGQRIVVDGGKYGYKSDKWRNYALSYKAHNSIDIGDFDILKVKPYGSCLERPITHLNGVIEFTGELSYPALGHRRTLISHPDCWVVVVDQVWSKRRRYMSRYHHFSPDLALKSLVESSISLSVKELGDEIYVELFNSDRVPSVYLGSEQYMQGFVSEKDYKISEALAIEEGPTNTVSWKPISIISRSSQKSEEAASEFLRLYSHQLSAREVEEIKARCTLNEPLIDRVPHYTFLDGHLPGWPVGERTVRIYHKGLPVNAHLRVLKKAVGRRNKLMVQLPGATDRSKGYLDFQRYSWGGQYNRNVLTLSDPTITSDNDLSLGWFQGSPGVFGVDAAEAMIREVLRVGNILEKDVVIFGSSGGGFAALKLAERFDAAQVIAINPQIFLYNYTKSYFNRMLKSVYPGFEENDFINKFKDRIVVSEKSFFRTGKTFIFQNRCDEKHMKRHLGPLLKKVGNGLAVVESENALDLNMDSVIYYDDAERGHSPPSNSETMALLRRIDCLSMVG
ncbi:YqiA/YcfP family alpha/beta fold hydrolase [Spiribacter roseus]|uniref:YqiA/YcfP family alpha/beta fold hydrolase n=1 Tax=Spiribacter roseus TaxID=1855875 RepID=UPI001F3E8389|nr:YqiA/YcfP family alpha/beta fold hydrolase [Spiribacter roseus]